MGPAKEKSLTGTKDGKVCSNCNELKNFECYDKKTKLKDGNYTYVSRCKICRAVIRKQNLIKLNSNCIVKIDEFEVIELEDDDYLKFFHEKALRDFALEIIFELESTNIKK